MARNPGGIFLPSTVVHYHGIVVVQMIPTNRRISLNPQERSVKAKNLFYRTRNRTEKKEKSLSSLYIPFKGLSLRGICFTAYCRGPKELLCFQLLWTDRLRQALRGCGCEHRGLHSPDVSEAGVGTEKTTKNTLGR